MAMGITEPVAKLVAVVTVGVKRLLKVRDNETRHRLNVNMRVLMAAQHH